MEKKVYLAVLFNFIIFCLIFTLSCRKNLSQLSSTPEAPKTDTIKPGPPGNLILNHLHLGKWVPCSFSSFFQSDGVAELVPSARISLSAPVSGRVAELFIRPGMSVKKGQVLAVLESIEYINIQKDYLTEKYILTQVESEYNRQKSLISMRTVSEKSFEEIEARLGSQKASLKALEEKLRCMGIEPSGVQESNLSRKLLLRAPSNGLVASVQVHMGKQVTPQEALCELWDLAGIQLKFLVFGDDLQGVSVGQPIEAWSTFSPETKWKGRVEYVGAMSEKEKYTPVYCSLMEGGQEIRPGWPVSARFFNAPKPAWKVPNGALVFLGERSLIFKSKALGQFEPIPVKVLQLGKDSSIIKCLEKACSDDDIFLFSQANVLYGILKSGSAD